MSSELNDFITKLAEEIKNAPKRFIEKTIVDDQARTNLYKLYSNDRPAYLGFISVSRDNHVSLVDTITLERQMKLESRNQTQSVSILQAKVKSRIPEAPVHNDCILPLNYSITSESEIKYEGPGKRHGNLACQYPVFIKDIRKSKSEKIEYVTLTWLKDGRWEEHTDEKKVIAQAKLIADLSSRGIPVTSNNACDLVEYLYRYERTNSGRIPVLSIRSKLGWTENMTGFLLGKEYITGEVNSDSSGNSNTKLPQVMFKGKDIGDTELAEGFKSHGDYSQWVSVVNTLFDYPEVIFTIYASLTTPFLELFGAENFCMELSNPTSTGKSTCLKLAASCWGEPDPRERSFIRTWNSSDTFIGRAASVLNGLPLILDDTQLVLRNSGYRRQEENVVTQTVYMVSSGLDKGRGTLGGTATTGSFKTILISSGEKPSFDSSQAGGERARLISLWGKPFLATDENTQNVVDNVKHIISEHYGHAGAKLVKFILKNRDQWPLWKKAYQELSKKMSNIGEMSSIEMRLASYFATVGTAIPIIHAALPELPRDKHIKPILETVWSMAQQEANENEPGLMALKVIYDWFWKNNHKFYSLKDYLNKIQYVGSNYIGYWDSDPSGSWSFIGFDSSLTNTLRSNGFNNPTEILKNWKSKGWLTTNKSSSGLQKQVPIPGADNMKQNLYCIEKSVFYSI